MVQVVAKGSHEAYVITGTSQGVSYCLELSERLFQHPAQLTLVLDRGLQELVDDIAEQLLNGVSNANHND